MIPNTFKGMIRDGSRAAEVLKDVNDDQFVPLTELMVFSSEVAPTVVCFVERYPSSYRACIFFLLASS